MKISTAKNLTNADIGKSYTIKGIADVGEDLKGFLFSLGCFDGEEITLISTLADNYVIHIKNARYSIDCELAEAILI